jgi:hypothetical protein
VALLIIPGRDAGVVLIVRMDVKALMQVDIGSPERYFHTLLC